MVQVRDSNGLSPSSYWKLEPAENTLYNAMYDLDEAHYPFEIIGASLEQLNYLRTRAERGLISYQSCTVKELRKFARQRRIPRRTRRTKAALVQMLHGEDEGCTAGLSGTNTTAHPFSTVATELQYMIFDYYLAPFIEYFREKEGGNTAIAPPPLARTNRALRKASLTYLYSSVRISCTVREVYMGIELGNRFFAKASAGLLAYVKKLKLQRKAGDGHAWIIDLPKGVEEGERRYTVIYQPEHHSHRRVQANAIAQTERAIKQWIEQLLKDYGAQFSYEDVGVLQSCIQY